MHQTLHVGRLGRAVHYDGALAPIPGRNRRDRRVVLVVGERVLEFHHRVAVIEKLGRG